MKNLLIALLSGLSLAAVNAPAFAQASVESSQVDISGCITDQAALDAKLANLEPVVITMNINSKDIGLVQAGDMLTFSYGFNVNMNPVLEGIDRACVDAGSVTIGYEANAVLLDSTYFTMVSGYQRSEWNDGFGFSGGSIGNGRNFRVQANNLPDGEFLKEFTVPVEVTVTFDTLILPLKHAPADSFNSLH